MLQFRDQAAGLIYLVGKQNTGGFPVDPKLNVIDSRVPGQTSRLLREIHVGLTQTHLNSYGQLGLLPVPLPDHGSDIRQHPLEFFRL